MIVASFYAPRFEKWKDCDYDELLILVDKSCKKVGLNHIVISDSPRPNLETFITDLPANLMQAILYGQMKILEKAKESVLLIGADCVLTRYISNFDSDIAITLGPFSDCEMNTGMIWCGNTKLCAKVWKSALDLNPSEWGEDQTCLYESVLDFEPSLKITRLKCEEYNWAPNHVNDNAGMPAVVHFRGNRKRYMKQWCEQFPGII